MKLPRVPNKNWNLEPVGVWSLKHRVVPKLKTEYHSAHPQSDMWGKFNQKSVHPHKIGNPGTHTKKYHKCHNSRCLHLRVKIKYVNQDISPPETSIHIIIVLGKRDLAETENRNLKTAIMNMFRETKEDIKKSLNEYWVNTNNSTKYKINSIY